MAKEQKKGKRFLPWLMVLSMMLSLAPVNAFAEESNDSTSESYCPDSESKTESFDESSDNSSEDEDGAEKISDTVLSLDAIPEDDVKSAAWLADSRDCMEELITALKEKELLSILTEKQRELYLAMTREGLTLREFARRKGIGIRAAFDLKAAVQKKFQRIF